MCTIPLATIRARPSLAGQAWGDPGAGVGGGTAGLRQFLGRCVRTKGRIWGGWAPHRVLVNPPVRCPCPPGSWDGSSSLSREQRGDAGLLRGAVRNGMLRDRGVLVGLGDLAVFAFFLRRCSDLRGFSECGIAHSPTIRCGPPGAHMGQWDRWSTHTASLPCAMFKYPTRPGDLPPK